MPKPRKNGARRDSVPRRPEKESPAEAGQVHPGRKIKMKRTNTPTADRGCFEACRPVAATGSRPRRRDWFRVRNVTAIEFQKSRRCGESGSPLPSESSRVTPRDTRNPA
jgi:hypothetical protein